MKYYELHEEFWKQLKEEGHISWDREKQSDIVFNKRNYALNEFMGNMPIGTALDLGCGSGSQSFFLSNLGFKCTAVDISQTAIDIGNKLALDMKANIEFHCEDVCSLNLGQTYDLVTDSCLLHCIVTDEDRIQFYETVKIHMHSESYFFVYTMVRNAEQSMFEDVDHLYLCNDDGIVWSKGSDSFDVNWTEINGEKYFPHRRILTANGQKEEIIDNEFEVIRDVVLENEGSEKLLYAAWLKMK